MVLDIRLTLLQPQSRFGDKPLKFQVVCPQNGTAVLKGLTPQFSRSQFWVTEVCCYLKPLRLQPSFEDKPLKF